MYHEQLELHGDEFDARMGAEAIRELLRTTDLDAEIENVPRGARDDRFGGPHEEADEAAEAS